jgi:hypothetical protein
MDNKMSPPPHQTDEWLLGLIALVCSRFTEAKALPGNDALGSPVIDITAVFQVYTVLVELKTLYDFVYENIEYIHCPSAVTDNKAMPTPVASCACEKNRPTSRLHCQG